MRVNVPQQESAEQQHLRIVGVALQCNAAHCCFNDTKTAPYASLDDEVGDVALSTHELAKPRFRDSQQKTWRDSAGLDNGGLRIQQVVLAAEVKGANLVVDPSPIQRIGKDDVDAAIKHHE